jgi:hypothetical protein
VNELPRLKALRTIHLYGSTLTKTAVAMLQKALPDCTIKP